jgi:uncharacterized membrane protein YtjA (UPF0391 family)
LSARAYANSGLSPTARPNQPVESIQTKFAIWRVLMLQLAAILLLIAIVAAVFGFGGFVAGAVGAAKVLFMLFLIGAIIAFLMGRRSV